MAIRYDDGGRKLLFKVECYNRSGPPINFGPENLSITLDTGAALSIHDFDGLRDEARADADQVRTLANLKVAAGAYAPTRSGGAIRSAGAP